MTVDQLYKQLSKVDDEIADARATIAQQRVDWHRACSSGFHGHAQELEAGSAEVEKQIVRLNTQRNAICQQLYEAQQWHRNEAASVHVAQAAQELDGIAATLREMGVSYATLVQQITTLQQQAKALAECAHHARQHNARLPAFISSPAKRECDLLTINLKLAGQQVGGVANDLLRFVP